MLRGGRAVLNQCYQMQTSVMLYYNSGDMASTSQMCEQAPGAMRYVWSPRALGRDIRAYANGDGQRPCACARSPIPNISRGVIRRGQEFHRLDRETEDRTAYRQAVPRRS